MKNRFIVAIGALAVALAVGGYAILRNNHTPAKAPEAASSSTPLDKEQAVPASATPNTGHTDTTDTTTPAGTENNKHGSTDAKTQDAKAVSVPETYTVAEGDTLRTIAQKYYNDAIYSADIERMNSLDNPDMLKVGQVLQMPRPDQLNAAASAPSPAKSTDSKTDTKAETKADKDTTNQ